MVKEKPNSIRTYDKEGFRRRAACLCFKDDAEKEILLVTSSKDREKWVVPGGGVEPLEDPRNTAEREALEEAGVRGNLGRHIGMFENIEKNHRTTVYVFLVTELMDDWEDKRAMGRTREWFTIADAHAKLSHKPIQLHYLRELLEKPLDMVT
ncbi:diphosphoinositol polyphosphate phosphohydrolase 2-like [Mizuhopecten yessoensis]|uniref:diphosphoinositol-polyphosphate diphosphatase n=1 Tax=Mizuhopecten yessoensis TaxID=6573 RepID=A0A210R077_MIZYE|nr:diphosphoinositol polyphosphate phosphohydrolase 2-like [Mizuhopecten yessoensis]OWF54423.1 Diphosphoinositol polyphosphate phosphohydrolase 1 [Mizuhopecten yessoensis]